MKKTVLPAFLLISLAANSQCNDLFFSEYLEGASNNKAIEVYNPTSSPINLTDYVIYRANNGSPVPTDSLFPQDVLAPGDVWVAGNPSADPAILAVSDSLHTITFFNGDDALWIKKISTGITLDVIGQLGVDPGTNWPVGTGATSEFTLTRMVGVQQGNTNWAVAATEYDVFAQNTFNFLGSHTMTPCCLPPVAQVLTQVDPACNGGTDGTIQINVTGNGPFTYTWVNRPETTPFLTNVPAGTYTMIASGSCGNDTIVVTLSEPAVVSVQVVQPVNPTCFGYTDGSIAVSVTGGTSPYSYAWSSGGTNPIETGLGDGAYTVVVTDANGCTGMTGAVLTQPSPIGVTVSLNYDTVCVSTVSLPLSGGSPSGGIYSGADVLADSSFAPSVIGWSVVTYTYTNGNGCSESAVDSIWVDGCMNIAEDGDHSLAISPNPFTDVVTVQSDGSDNAISVYNMQGQLLHTANIIGNVTTLSLAELPVGIYTIQVVNENGVMTKKIQKAE